MTLPTDEAISFRIASACTTLVARAAADLTALPAELDRRVHAVRVAMKRLDAFLGLLPDAPAVRAATRTVRRAKSFLASHRDASVALALLDEIGADEAHRRSFLAAHCPHWTARNTQRAERLAAGLERDVAPAVGSPIACVPVLEAWLDLHRRTRRMAKRCLRKPDDDGLHELRKSVKRLLYQTEVLDSIAVLHPVATRAAALAALLGKHHDLVVLEAAAASLEAPRKLLRKLAREKKAATRAALAAARDGFPTKTAHLRKELLQ